MSGKSYFRFVGEDQVGDFWVVEYPGRDSELSDIFFQADIFDMALQIRGGLDPETIYGIYKSKGLALKKAKELLLKRDNDLR